MGTLTWCIDQALHVVGGAPTYLLTDNARTVTMDHVAGIPVRHPEMVALGRHYGCKVETCVPFDPESKGGAGATVKIAKADLVPSGANLLPAYGDFAGLEEACREFCGRVNGRVHRETAAIPADRLAAEREHLHPLPDEPHALALGEERLVGDDQTIRFGSVRYSTPPGHSGTRVWCRAAGEELVITARTGCGAAEIARHRLSVPGSPSICGEHYPGPASRTWSRPWPTPRSRRTCASPGSPSKPSPPRSAGPKPTGRSPAPSPGSAAATSSWSMTSACCPPGRTPPRRSTASPTPPTNAAPSP